MATRNQRRRAARLARRNEADVRALRRAYPECRVEPSRDGSAYIVDGPALRGAILYRRPLYEGDVGHWAH